MTVFTYGEGGGLSHFEVKSTAGAADYSGALVITSAGVVSVNGAVVFAAGETHSGVMTMTGRVTMSATLGFGAALVCAMTIPVTVSGVGGTNTLIMNRRLLIQDGAGNAIYLLGTTSAQ